jgi:hypothetical protein
MGVDSSGELTAEFSVSDQAQLRSLAEWVSASGEETDVRQQAGVPGPGEQGALDVLTVLASSSGLIAAIKVLPEFLRSRRSGLTVTCTIKGQPFALTATNIDDVMPVITAVLEKVS